MNNTFYKYCTTPFETTRVVQRVGNLKLEVRVKLGTSGRRYRLWYQLREGRWIGGAFVGTLILGQGAKSLLVWSRG